MGRKFASFIDDIGSGRDATTPGIDGEQIGKKHEERVNNDVKFNDKRDAVGRAASRYIVKADTRIGEEVIKKGTILDMVEVDNSLGRVANLRKDYILAESFPVENLTKLSSRDERIMNVESSLKRYRVTASIKNAEGHIIKAGTVLELVEVPEGSRVASNLILASEIPSDVIEPLRERRDYGRRASNMIVVSIQVTDVEDFVKKMIGLGLDAAPTYNKMNDEVLVKLYSEEQKNLLKKAMLRMGWEKDDFEEDGIYSELSRKIKVSRDEENMEVRASVDEEIVKGDIVEFSQDAEGLGWDDLEEEYWEKEINVKGIVVKVDEDNEEVKIKVIEPIEKKNKFIEVPMFAIENVIKSKKASVDEEEEYEVFADVDDEEDLLGDDYSDVEEMDDEIEEYEVEAEDQCDGDNFIEVESSSKYKKASKNCGDSNWTPEY